MRKRFIFYLLLSIPLLLTDAHFSELLYEFSFSHFMVTSYLFVTILFLFCQSEYSQWSFAYAIIFGTIYDYYYFSFLGITVLSLPLFSLTAFGFKKIFSKNLSVFQESLLYTICLFIYVIVTFLLQRNHQFINLSLSFFITYHFLPSLFFNLGIFVIFHKQLHRFFY
ncbi:rod shape-determining protein MreD [Streptococcus uberis]|uniref:rod shape-determining protein MreD n=1 Tax=Streptococcus uberis TaxID=1349 RepID=UPI003EF7183B